ncbi:MAG: YihY/virulence factor BrkB family protein [Thermodesulfovibrionales bacterium]|nr:YihY/virulence factor BrkB family protein [Thermodesulfovibrionales bacterium]
MILEIFKETFISFRRNNCMNMAASLAFFASLSLIPSLFLIAYLSGSIIGSSKMALIKVQELINQFIPRYSDIVLMEIKNIIAFKKGLGFINLIVLFSTILPLASSLRTSLTTIFRIEIKKPILIETLIDSAIIMLFIAGLTLITMKDLFISPIRTLMPLFNMSFFINIILPGITVFLLTLFIFIAFTFGGWNPRLNIPKIFNLFNIPQMSFRIKIKNLAAGAFVTTLLWFGLKPLFNIILKYNPGYGFIFGSFKSLFIIMIWIYYSQITFLFGAELAACLQRKEAIMLKRAIRKDRPIPEKLRAKYVLVFKSGEIIFNENEQGDRMYYILKGKVTIEKSGREVMTVGEGSFIGEISFLLNKPHPASARAQEDTELLLINCQNIEQLLHEIPELFSEILKNMALRLEKTNSVVA